MASLTKKAADDVYIGGALDKDDLFNILQEQIDTLSNKARSPDGISRDDLKPLIKAISDLRGVGLGADETVKKAVDFQMKMTKQLVVQQDIKSALASRKYEDMRAAVLAARDANVRTRQFKTLESELQLINKELLRKAEEENQRLRKLQSGKPGNEDEAAQQQPKSSPPSGAAAGNKSFNAGAAGETSSSASGKRFLWRRSVDKRPKNGQQESTPDDYQLEDEGNGDSSPAGGAEKRKSMIKLVSSRLSFKKVPPSNANGPSASSSANGRQAPSPSTSMPQDEASLDDFLLQDNPALANALNSGVSEFQRQAQFDRLVEAMQRVKTVLDSPSEIRGPSPILAAAGTDLDLVTGDPNTVHLWLGEWHGIVKSTSSSGNISSKTILVGEIDSKVSHGRWEIRMAKPDIALQNAVVAASATPSKSPTAISSNAVAAASPETKENDGAREQKYLSEIEILRLQIEELQSELKHAKESTPLTAGADVRALISGRSESIRIEAEQEEQEMKEERRRLQNLRDGEEDDGPSVPFSKSARASPSLKDLALDEIDVDMMTLKELKQFITSKGGSAEGDKDTLYRRAKELKGSSASSDNDKLNKLFSGSSSFGAGDADGSAATPLETGDGPRVKDEERFQKYFKMQKVGLDKEAIKHKMIQDGLEGDVMVLDVDPNMLMTEFERRKKATSHSGAKLQDDERFAKYFRMLKVGLTKDAIKHKMVQDGFDPDILDMDPDGPADDIPPKELAPFLKMLQYGVPRAVVEYKMKSNNLDPALLDKFVPKDIPRLDIKVGEDPRFVPFFKMIAVGVPRDAVKQKMIQKGFDPDILDMNPEEFSPVDGSNINPNKSKKKRKRPDDGMQWKKLYWQTVDVPASGAGVPRTVWTRDFGFELLDHEKQELRSLFSIKVGPAKGEAGVEGDVKQAPKEDKSLQILESTRAQNVSILLSRFKISIMDIKRMVCTMRVSDSLDLAPDDVKSILSMLPSAEEAEKLRAVPPAKRELLGAAEKHFLGLMEIPRFRSRIACFLFKLQFNELKEDVEFDVEALQLAINDLLDSQKLARLLNIILSIGNLLNSCGGLLTEEDGFKPAQGFRLSSLSKLRLAKAHTSPRTALNFFVSVLHERQRQVLDFIIRETDHIRAAASVVMSNVKGQIKGLAMGVKELENEVNHAESVRSDPEASKKMTQEDEIFFDAVEAFFQKSRRDVHDLSMAINKAEKDFQILVGYFREEPDTTPEALFKHLVAFFDEVAAALHENDIARAKAVRKANALEDSTTADDL